MLIFFFLPNLLNISLGSLKASLLEKGDRRGSWLFLVALSALGRDGQDEDDQSLDTEGSSCHILWQRNLFSWGLSIPAK